MTGRAAGFGSNRRPELWTPAGAITERRRGAAIDGGGREQNPPATVGPAHLKVKQMTTP